MTVHLNFIEYHCIMKINYQSIYLLTYLPTLSVIFMVHIWNSGFDKRKGKIQYVAHMKVVHRVVR